MSIQYSKPGFEPTTTRQGLPPLNEKCCCISGSKVFHFFKPLKTLLTELTLLLE